MNWEHITNLYFSATGTTKKVAETISSCFESEKTTYDLLKKPLEKDYIMKENELLIVGMPVYAGRIPRICSEMLLHLKGHNTPAIIAVAFGNRDYDDALLELKNLLENNGFLVVGAGAFIGQHSIFPKVGKGRPNEKDCLDITAFSNQCKEKLLEMTVENFKELEVKGNTNYKIPGPIPLKPSGNRKCNNCGLCVKICPTNAISKEKPRKTNGVTCISCGACIVICPQKARDFHGLPYRVVAKGFLKKKQDPKKPETFI